MSATTSSEGQHILDCFTEALISVFHDLIRSGMDQTRAEQEILTRLAPSATATIDPQQVADYIVQGKLKKHEAIRAIVIHRELDALICKGKSLGEAIEELIVRMKGSNAEIVMGECEQIMVRDGEKEEQVVQKQTKNDTRKRNKTNIKIKHKKKQKLF
jgi:hypothetical protein